MQKSDDIRFIPGKNLSKSLNDCLDREWLETNGLGGYASSTIPRCPTRKYHGLLVHPLEGHQGRFLLLENLEPELILPDGEAFLGSNLYTDAEHPGGYRYLKEFRPFPNPSWLWENDRFSLTEEMIMPQGEPRILIRYRLSENSVSLTLRLKPLIGYRDAHGLTFENPGITPSFHSRPRELSLTVYPGMPNLHFAFSEEYSFHYAPFWDKGVRYRKEAERGFDHTEDRFVPGLFFLELNPGEAVTLSVGLSKTSPQDLGLEASFYEEKRRRRRRQARYSGTSPALEILKTRAEQFLVKNEKGEDSIIAGYPWFGEWGRDTMIALPGLTLATGEEKTAAGILEAYASYIKRGLLPNTLGGLQGFTSYNSLDASLLYIAAIQAADPYLCGSRFYPGEKEFEKRFFGPVKEILTAFFRNKVPHTQLGDDGLINAGSEETQLTWMDATAYGKPVTPRHGKAVDINALWYNALCYFLELQRRLGKNPSRKAESLVLNLPSLYRKSFWLPKEGYLADCITPEGKDASLRPNMLFPLALPFSPLTRREKKGVLAAVEAKLLTPLGLRTLSPEDPRFVPRYAGNGDERDAAYHQGTVWPWPLELYIIGSVRTFPKDLALRERLKEYLANLMEMHLLAEGMGSISEIFDGITPGRGKGCIAQAWSVAAILRSWEFMEKYPDH